MNQSFVFAFAAIISTAIACGDPETVHKRSNTSEATIELEKEKSSQTFHFSAQPKSFFTDNFNRPLLGSDWIAPSSAALEITNGVLHNKTANKKVSFVQLAKIQSTTNQQIVATFLPVGKSNAGKIELFSRYEKTGKSESYYSAIVGTTNFLTFQVTINRVVQGKSTALATRSYTRRGSPSTPIVITFDLLDVRSRVKIDSFELSHVDVTPLLTGNAVGVRISSGGLDDLKVADLEPGPPSCSLKQTSLTGIGNSGLSTLAWTADFTSGGTVQSASLQVGAGNATGVGISSSLTANGTATFSTLGKHTIRVSGVGPGGEGSCQLEVNVNYAPPTCTLTPDKPVYKKGDVVSLKLQWTGIASKASYYDMPHAQQTVDLLVAARSNNAVTSKPVSAFALGSVALRGRVSGPGGTTECDAKFRNLPDDCSVILLYSGCNNGDNYGPKWELVVPANNFIDRGPNVKMMQRYSRKTFLPGASDPPSGTGHSFSTARYKNFDYIQTDCTMLNNTACIK